LLVEQPGELRSALLSGNFMQANACVYLSAAEGHLSDDAQRVVRGLATYFEHMWFMARRDRDGAATCLRLACEESGSQMRDLTRLANLMTGIAVGSLSRQNFTEAQNLANSVLEPEHAEAIMRKITARRPMLQRWLSSAMRIARQEIVVKTRSR
jgi:hypothetical protein